MFIKDIQKKLSSVENAVKDIKDGKMIIVINDSDAENVGDLVCSSEKITPTIINFMTKYARGTIYISMKHDRLEELGIKNMVEISTQKNRCSFTVSVDYKIGTTGISAYDRAITIKKLITKNSKEHDFFKPGHVFPLKYKEGGVLIRSGHTEAAVDLVVIAGLYPSGVICTIMNDDGLILKNKELLKFSRKHNLNLITIKELISYRCCSEKNIEKIVKVDFPTKFGKFKLILFKDVITKTSHIALIKGNVESQKNILVRVHSSCETGDALHSLRCDCGTQLSLAMETINKKGIGVILYMHQEGRGIGLTNKLKAYHLQEKKGMDTVAANIALGFNPDLRDYRIAAQILLYLGIKNINIMTNNPKKVKELEKYGLKIVKRIAIEVNSTKYNEKYLKTKKEKMGHILQKI
ncbi:MAG: GTP cyclohydrolase II [Endomicrobium sp.]|jgi:3,4-dihydroxy 2-butanone 4-phosphate synthase/GTP cyclohydrolase II|nr:GTP cyclohydrolase II [Endomicrobium sp.]